MYIVNRVSYKIGTNMLKQYVCNIVDNVRAHRNVTIFIFALLKVINIEGERKKCSHVKTANSKIKPSIVFQTAFGDFKCDFNLLPKSVWKTINALAIFEVLIGSAFKSKQSEQKSHTRKTQIASYVLQKFNWRDYTITFILTILLTPLIYLIISIFRFYRFVIYSILKYKLGSKLYGLLEGDEVFFNLLDTNEAKSVITVLLEVEFKGSGNDFFKIASEEVFRVFSGSKFEKLQCTREEYLGYFGFYYFRKCNVTKEEYIKEFGNEDFKSSLGRIANCALPKNNKAMWDVHISKKISENCYPIVFRFHHSVGDAVTVFNIFNKEFSGNTAKIRLQHDSIYPILSNDDKIKVLVPKSAERNDLIGALTGEKHLVWFAEKEAKYLSVIKQIKNNHKATFTDILVTALSSSLNEYCKKKNYCKPDNIFVAVLLMQNENFSSYKNHIDYSLSNKFSIGFIEAPLEQENLVRRLQIISKEYNDLKNESIDFIFNRWQGKVLFKFLPIGILQGYLYTQDMTALLSNIPGCESLEIFNGSKVKEFVIFDPNNLKSGISLMVSTYENRLNLAFTFDKLIVPNYEDGEEICRNTLKCFDKLYEECH